MRHVFLSIDVSGLVANLTKALDGAWAAMQRTFLPSVNRATADTRNAVIQEVSRDTGLPLPAVAEAVETVSASTGKPAGTTTGVPLPTGRGVLSASSSIQADNRDAPYFRWHTMLDERVCEVCGPRHDQIFRVGEVDYPAHPGCRCTITFIDIVERLVRAAPPHLERHLTQAAQAQMDAFRQGFKS